MLTIPRRPRITDLFVLRFSSRRAALSRNRRPGSGACDVWFEGECGREFVLEAGRILYHTVWCRQLCAPAADSAYFGTGNGIGTTTIGSSGTLVPETIGGLVCLSGILDCLASNSSKDFSGWKWKGRTVFTEATIACCRRGIS